MFESTNKKQNVSRGSGGKEARVMRSTKQDEKKMFMESFCLATIFIALIRFALNQNNLISNLDFHKFPYSKKLLRNLKIHLKRSLNVSFKENR